MDSLMFSMQGEMKGGRDDTLLLLSHTHAHNVNVRARSCLSSHKLASPIDVPIVPLLPRAAPDHYQLNPCPHSPYSPDM